MQASHLRKYGVEATINFDLFEIDGVDFRVDASHASGDTKIMKDEGAEANTTNGFTDEGNGYSIVLTATEMEAARIVVYVIDSATKAWLDRAIVIETYGNANAQHALDLDDAVRGGMTALPDAAADAAGGLAISDAGGLDLDTKLANTNEVTAARMGALTDLIDGGRLDLILDDILLDTGTTLPTTLVAIAEYIDTEIAEIIATIGVAGAGLTDLGGMSTAMKAEAQAEATAALVAMFTDAATLVDLIADEPFTGVAHNVPNSFAKRLRDLQEFGTYEGGHVFLDSVGGTTGTTDYEHGTILNALSSLPNANTVAASLGLSRFAIAPASSFTLTASQEGQSFRGERWTLALGGQSISGSHIMGADVSGICSGAVLPEFHQCHLGDMTIPAARSHYCDVTGTIVLSTGTTDFHNCSSENGATLDFGAAVGDSTVYWTDFSGDLTIENFGQNGTDVLNIRGHGKLTLAASCVGGAIKWDGHFTIINNGTTSDITKDEISENVDTVGVAITAIKAKTDNLPSGIPKNVALAAFPLFMVDSSDKVTGKTGESVTAQRSIDGAAFGACANSVTETGNGVYKIDLEASDLNGDTIVFKFTSANALARIIGVVTQS
jgi:hypothetical protein